MKCERGVLLSKEIGQRLRRARESLGLTLADVSRRTNIPIKFIIVIEKGEWERLPNTIYARAYVKTYAKLVGETVQFSQMSRRRSIHETMVSTQTYQRDSYYTPRQSTRKLRQIQGEVIDKTDSEQEENHVSTQTQSPDQKPRSTGAKTDRESIYESLPSRREKENELRRKKERSKDYLNNWYDRILLISAILLIIGFSIFFIIKATSPPGISSA